MNDHYTTGELLTHAYVPDDAAVEQHLAACASCARRFTELRSRIHDHASDAGMPDLPETFWKRQELSVMRAVERRGRRSPGVAAQFAAAAALLLVITAFLVGRGSVETAGSPVATVTSTIASSSASPAAAAQDNALTGSQITTDPWESEQLEDFQSVVDWENWVETDGKNRGTI